MVEVVHDVDGKTAVQTMAAKLKAALAQSHPLPTIDGLPIISTWGDDKFTYYRVTNLDGTPGTVKKPLPPATPPPEQP